MSSITKLIAILFFLTISSKDVYCQCSDFHRSNDCYVYVPLDTEYKIYNQARSISVKIQTPVIYKVILFGKRDYIIGVCSSANYYRKIKLRIINSQNNKVLFDNSDNDFIESFMLTVEKTTALDLEVTVLTDKETDIGSVCVGIQILTKKDLR